LRKKFRLYFDDNFSKLKGEWMERRKEKKFQTKRIRINSFF
jgi:hypothetical protein